MTAKPCRFVDVVVTCLHLVYDILVVVYDILVEIAYTKWAQIKVILKPVLFFIRAF